MGNITKFEKKQDPSKKYIEKFQEQLGTRKTREAVVGSVSVLNASTIAVEGTGQLDEKEKDAIITFTDWFYEKYGNDKRLWKAIRRNWPDAPPRILRMGEYFKEERQIEEAKAVYKELNPKMQKDVNLLVSYLIKERKGDSLMTFTWDGGESTIQIERYEKKSEYKDAILSCIIRCLYNRGVLIYRRVIGKDLEIVNGFRIDEWIEDVEKEELKYCMELQPDGTMKTFPEDRYEESGLPFAEMG